MGATVVLGDEQAETDEQGSVALKILPYVKVRVKSRYGSGSAELRPLCGAGRTRLVVGKDRLQVVMDALRWSDLGVEPKQPRAETP